MYKILSLEEIVSHRISILRQVYETIVVPKEKNKQKEALKQLQSGLQAFSLGTYDLDSQLELSKKFIELFNLLNTYAGKGATPRRATEDSINTLRFSVESSKPKFKEKGQFFGAALADALDAMGIIKFNQNSVGDAVFDASVIKRFSDDAQFFLKDVYLFFQIKTLLLESDNPKKCRVEIVRELNLKEMLGEPRELSAHPTILTIRGQKTQLQLQGLPKVDSQNTTTHNQEVNDPTEFFLRKMSQIKLID